MRRQMAGLLIAGMLVAGCGGDDAGGLFDQMRGLGDDPSDEPAHDANDAADDPAGDAAEPDGPAETAPEVPVQPDGAGTGGAGTGGDGTDGDGMAELDPADFPLIAERTIDQVVLYGTIEWSIEEMIVVDLDADLQPGERPQGVELTFPTRVFNASSNTASVNTTSIALQWDDPGTGDTFTVPVQADFRDVPAESFTSGELRVVLPPEDQVIFDDDSAYLLVGRAGITPAVVPIGSGVELVDRLPVQLDTDGWTLEIEGEDEARRAIADAVIVTGAEVRWSGPEGRPLDDGLSLLEIAYTVENRGEAQTCSQRSEGGWRLTLPNGDSVNDLRVSERCVAMGDTVTDILTGFLIPTEEFAGDYLLLHRRGSGGEDDPDDEVDITLAEGDGVRPSEAD